MCCHYPCPVLQISSFHPFTHSYPFPDPLEVKSKSLTHYHIKFAYLCTYLNTKREERNTDKQADRHIKRQRDRDKEAVIKDIDTCDIQMA